MTINNINLETLIDTSLVEGKPINEVYWKISGEINGRRVFYTTITEPKRIKEIKEELLWVYNVVTRG